MDSELLNVIWNNTYILVIVLGVVTFIGVAWKAFAKKNNLPSEPLETVLEMAQDKVEDRIEEIKAKNSVPVLAKDIIDRDSVVYNINQTAIKIINIDGRNYEVLDDYSLVPFNSHKS